MARPVSPIQPFDYLDYRRFLRDWYEHAKQHRRGFSFRQFSKKAGFGAPNFLKRIMDGERNLSLESLPAFMDGLGLNKQEREFFQNLVLFNQAETHDTKDHYYRGLLRSQKFSQLKPLEKDQYDYYSAWYHPVVRELLVSPDGDGTPEWVSTRVCPAITTQQARDSIALLERLMFVRRGVDEKWQLAQPLVTTGARAMSFVMLNYHQNVLELVRERLPKTLSTQRDVSTLTLGVVKERIPQLKRKIEEFRREVLKLVSDDVKPEEVVLLAIQLLPVTQSAFSDTVALQNQKPARPT